ncbi:unnamed protein product, partial [Discosporangium mesarthrocarpum]
MAEERVQRKLAAILAADVVGYSRLMGNEESATLLSLKRFLKELIEPTVSSYRGRIVKLMGDGILVEFSSVVDAVECAVSIQQGAVKLNADLPDDRHLRFRVGINLGDVIIDGDDLYGDGVNVAARLEGLAEAGGICISGPAYDQVRDKLDIHFSDLGEQQLKNINRPVQIYGVDLDFGDPSDSSTVPKVKSSPTLSSKPSIAVLPFANLSGDPEQEYFSDGVSEDIITLLSAWRVFPVVARQSSFAYKGQSQDVRTIATDLGARYLIQGSIRKGGQRIRVSAQLIDADNGHHLWADKYDGTVDDVFEIQDEITRQIVSVVEPEIEKAEIIRGAAKRTANLGAWDYYLRGRELLQKTTEPENLKARIMFEKAIEIDPDYSDAWAGISHVHQRDILLEVTKNRQQSEQFAIDAAQKAVALDQSSSLAHYALGSAYIWANQHQLSVVETRIAVELNPSNSHAWLALGNRLDIVGEAEEGISLLEKSLKLHPKDAHGHVYFGQLARAYIVSGSYERALNCLNRSILRRPDYAHTYHLLAICLGHLGRIDEAR